jgi:integrase
MNFKTQSENFLKAAKTRKRNPISDATARKYEASLEHAYSLFATRELSDVNNNALKTLVAKLSAEGLSASTITGVVTVTKLVVASAVDENGDQLFPRTWNHEFMDLPVIDPKTQKAPTIDTKSIYKALDSAKNQDSAFCALLAGSGLRVGEAQALFVGPEDSVNSTWDPETGTVYVKTTVVEDSNIQDGTKTPAGVREVDLAPELNAFLVATLHPVVGQRVFHGTKHELFCRKTAAARLATIPGFHSLRRFRVTHLRKHVPEGLLKFWIGHSNESISDRYDKIRVDIEARKSFAAKAGLGFQLPEVKS